MSDFDKSVSDIISYTGLKYDYIIRCIKELEDILKPYVKRGDKNSLLFNSSSMRIFDRIRQLKDKKMTLTSIKDQLETDLKTTNEDQNNLQNIPIENKITSETTITQSLMNRLEESNNKILESLELVLKSKEDIIEMQRLENQELKKQILLITDGKSPEQAREEFISKDVQIRMLKEKNENLLETTNTEKKRADEKTITLAIKEIELENIKDKVEELKDNFNKEKSKLEEKSLEVIKKEKEVLEQKNRLEKLEEEKKRIQREKEEELKRLELEKNTKLLEKEKLLREQEEKAKLLEAEKKALEEKNQLKEKKKLEILKELDALEGKWFVGTKRKELFKQLQDLG